MGKVKLKATKGNSDDKRPLDLKKGDSKPLVAGGQPEVQGSATGLGPALSTAVAGMAKTKKQKRKMRHEAFIRTVDLSWAGLASSAVSSATWRCCHLFKMAVVLHTSTTLDMCKNQDQVDWKLVQSQHIRQLEAGKIVKRKRWKKACVPRALDLKNLVDALPTMVERTAVKLGRTRRKPRASKSFQASKKLLEKDMKHLERVVNHPQFQVNPIDVVLEHLRQAYKS
ncbi:uncharacterized protein [Dermacentor albipictus]|uniref:uncharacterized protein isoform X7 n=1 Tax=Dermacentor albipictus TaxID=60249 RepID=UPI0031FCE77B